jgi:dTDP-3,4-didehydro-2,6-dideoxy-alpha-D-glucose 3-reductase
MTTPTPRPRAAARTPLRMGLLGCADIAWRKMLPAMGRVAEVTLVATASRDLAKAERFAARFVGAPVHGYAGLLARGDIDAVYIPLPTGLHHEWARRALDAGKHVLVEKSTAVSEAQVRDLVAGALAGRRCLMENFMFVHHSQHTAVQRMVAGGAIGEPRFFTSAFGIPPRDPDDIRYRHDLGGGALLDVGAYTLRASRLFLGSELTVAGSSLRHDQRLGVDTAGSALLVSAQDVVAQLSFGFESSYRSMYELWGTQGRIVLERAFTPPETLAPTVRLERGDRVEEIALPPDDQFANTLREFAHATTHNTFDEAAGEALICQAELIEQVRKHARKAR